MKKAQMNFITMNIFFLLLSSISYSQVESESLQPVVLEMQPASEPEGRSRREGSVSPADEGNKITEYSAQVISTNFTVPIIRFNSIDKNSSGAPTDRKGNVSFFNSIGAGIGYYWGRLTEVTDKDARVISTEMHNIFGFQAGFLFAANSSGSNNSNIFALTGGISVLNFQIGYGYEFGTLGVNEKRGFLTLAYGIPVAKLIKGGFFVTDKKDIASDNKKYFAQ